MCVCRSEEPLALAPLSTAKRLNVLSTAGLMTVGTEGRWAWYSVAGEHDLPETGRVILARGAPKSAKQKAAHESPQRPERILSITPEEPWQRYTRRDFQPRWNQCPVGA